MRGSRRSKAAMLDEALERRHGRRHPRLPGRHRPTGASRRSAAADRTRRRSRSPRREGRPLRHLHRRRRRLHHRPAHRAAARKLDQVTYEEMLELAGVGAKVLQTRSVGLAMREQHAAAGAVGVRGQAGHDDRRRAFRRSDMERNLITGIAADQNEARITLTGVARPARARSRRSSRRSPRRASRST